MPKIRRRQPRQILQRRGTQQLGAGQNAGAEARGLEALGKGIGAVGQAAESIGSTVGTIEAEKLNIGFKKRISENMQRIKAGDIPEGKDVGEYSRELYNEAVNETLSQTSNPWARQKLNRSFNQFQVGYDQNVTNVIRSNFLKETEDSFKTIISESGAAVLGAPKGQRQAMLMAQVESNQAFVEDLREQGENALADDYAKRNLENLRRTYVDSGTLEEDTAKSVLQGVQGKSDDPAVNELFQGMDAAQRTRSIKVLQSAIARYDRELFARTRDDVGNMSAMNSMGRTITPEQVQKSIANASQIDDAELRSKAFSAIRQESSFNANVVKGAAGKTLEELTADGQAYVAGQSGDAQAELASRERFEKFRQSEIRLRREDPKAAVDRIPSLQAMRVAALESGDETQRQAYYDKVVNTQAALGLSPSVISRNEAQQISAGLDAEPSLPRKAFFLDETLDSFGSRKAVAIEDLRRNEVISGDMIPYVYMQNPVSKQRLIANSKMRDDKRLTETQLSERASFTLNDVTKQIRTKMSKYRSQIENNPGIGPLLDQMEEAVRYDAIARGVNQEAKTAASAVDASVEQFIASEFINVSSGPSKVFTPRFDGAHPGTEDRIESFLDVAVEPKNIAKFNPDFNTDEFGSLEEFVENQEDNFFWQTNPKNSHELRLWMNTTTGVRSVTSGNQPITVNIKNISDGTDPLFQEVDNDLGSFKRGLMEGFKTPKGVVSRREGF